jgi:hypothetical protein
MTLPPLQRPFGTTALSPVMWAQILGISIAADRLLLNPAMPAVMPRRGKPIS